MRKSVIHVENESRFVVGIRLLGLMRQASNAPDHEAVALVVVNAEVSCIRLPIALCFFRCTRSPTGPLGRERRGSGAEKDCRRGGHESELGEHCRISCVATHTVLVCAPI
jgi:hypothetical protein